MLLLRPSNVRACRPPQAIAQLSRRFLPLQASRSYATNRRQVTVANDDGRVGWSDLSVREKAARTTQQSFNLGIIVVGVAMTGAVAYFLFEDVFSPNSKTSYFNRAVSRIKASDACVEALGPANKMVFYGESVRSSFRRARVHEPTPIASTSKDERTGVETLKMQFLVKGTIAEGWATMHLEKQPDDQEFVWVLLALDVKGHQRIYLEGKNEGGFRKASTKMFGVNWR